MLIVLNKVRRQTPKKMYYGILKSPWKNVRYLLIYLFDRENSLKQNVIERKNRMKNTLTS